MCVLSIKVPIRKKSGNLFNDPHNFHFERTQYYWKFICFYFAQFKINFFFLHLLKIYEILILKKKGGSYMS